jgi:hypothetical protein
MNIVSGQVVAAQLQFAGRIWFSAKLMLVTHSFLLGTFCRFRFPDCAKELS